MLNLSLAVFVAVTYLSNLDLLSISTQIFINRLTFSIGFILVIVFFNFCLIFPEKETKKSFVYQLLIIACLGLAAFAAFFDWMAVEKVVSGLVTFRPRYPGIFRLFFYVYALFAFWGIGILYQKIRKLKGKERTRVQYVFLATLLYIIYIFSTNLIPAYFGRRFFIGHTALGAIVFVGLISYAVIKHRLMDIKLVLLRSLAYLTMLGSLAGAFIFFVYYLKVYYQQFVDPDIVFVLASFIAAFGFQPLRRLAEKTTDNLFFRSNYDFNEALSKLSAVLNHGVVVSKLTDDLLGELKAILKAQNGLFILSKDENKFLYCLAKNSKSVTIEELEREEDIIKLREAGLEVVVNIPDDDKCYGVLALGPKQSGESYSTRDLRLLEIIAPQITMAIKTAKSQEELIEKVIEERQRINQDAHDRIYNRLGAMAKLSEAAAAQSKDKELFEQLDSGLRQTVVDLQKIVNKDTATIKTNGKLASSLKKICQQHQKDYNQAVKYSFKASNMLNLDDMAWDIECILQECLNNAGKHSGAKKIRVNLAQNNGNLVLEVADNGKGIHNLDISNLPQEHLGINGIIDRVAKFQGIVDINSNNDGTKILVSIPLG